jgi:hypothetical protein
VDGRAGVPDVGEAVAHRGRELDQAVETAAPDKMERRTQVDRLGRLSPRRRRAVERPLQARLVDADGAVAVRLEVESNPGGRVAVRRDRDGEPAPRRPDLTDTVPVGALALAADAHLCVAHAHAAVAVEDGDNELRRPIVATVRVLRLVRRLLLVLLRRRGHDAPMPGATAAGDQRDDRHEDEHASDHACSPTANSR